MMNVAGIIADQKKYFPSHTQQVIEYELEYFIYNGNNYGYYHRGVSQTYGTAKNVSDEYGLTKPSDTTMVTASSYYYGPSNTYFNTFKNLAILGFRYNSYYDGKKIRFENYGAYGASVHTLPDFVYDNVFGRMESHHGVLQRKQSNMAIKEFGMDAGQGFAPEDKSPTLYNQAGGNNLDPSSVFGRNCPSPYYCIQGRLDFADNQEMIDSIESVAVAGATEQVRVFYSGITPY